ncbi:MAG: FkbM family methyltransferase [Proteobacteria bacterium]|nr:FkbM family methyltransferase [Pseudomonadota bacterium]
MALIVDAGANIGASAVYFSAQYEPSLICAVEPEARNCTLLRLNCEGMNVKIFEAGIGSEDCYMSLQDPGHSDWGFRVVESGPVQVEVLSPATIVARAKKLEANAFPFIFKIDIEGSEDNLFAKNLEWLDDFPLIIIELHDWLFPFKGSSSNFLKAIACREFDILHQ